MIPRQPSPAERRRGSGKIALVLRNYQLDAVSRLRQSYAAGNRAPLLQSATGSGKTAIFSEIARSAWSKGRRVLIVTHRKELVEQASNKLAWAGVPHGIIAADFAASPEFPVQVCSIQTVVRRLKTIRSFDLIIIDEAHHCRAQSWRALIDSQPLAKLLGVTATPARLDGKGLGIHCGGPFDDLICGPPIAKLVKAGYLSPARYFVPHQQVDLTGVRTRGGDYVAAELAARVDQKAIIGNAVAKYAELASHLPTIAFCALVSHAEHVAEQFSAAGYRAASVDGTMPKDERDRLIAGLGNGSIEVLASCDLISEGLDVPALGAVILLRPTKSLVLHMQQIGRGMRPAPGKEALVVLDHAGNIRRHGRPDFERIWTLDGINQKPQVEARLRICRECEAANPIGVGVCENCGFEFPHRRGGRRTADEIPGDLAEISAEHLAELAAMPYCQAVVWAGRDRNKLLQVQLARGYKPGWVHYQMLEPQDAGLRGSAP